MKIFISYRRADSKYVVDRIRDRLVAALGERSIFRDIESIPLGKDFRDVLEDETTGCDVMLAVIGPQWAGLTDAQGNKRLHDPADFTRIEIETGLQRDGVLVIPILVMNAVMPLTQEIPQSLGDLLFRNAISVRNDPDFDHDMQRLISSIKETLDSAVSIKRKYFEPEVIYIPEGKFWMGNPAGEGIPNHETPVHEVFLPAYYIGKYPVRNEEYEEFIRQTGKSVDPKMGWNGQRVPRGAEKLPVTGVSWYDAVNYCEWLSTETGRVYILPNEAQWEKACRGGFDFVGNVRQWTCSLWGEKRLTPDSKYAYPWKDDRRNDLNANSQIQRVVRGSSMTDDLTLLRCSARSGQLPNDVGLPEARHSFRVVMIV